MSTTSTITSFSNWMQQFPEFNEAAAASASFHHATNIATSGSNISPSGNSSDPVKQTSRRSRASKKVPTTLLNAEPGNFRALVQQFTGCPIRPPSRRSGPINLNFSQWNEESIQSNNKNVPSASTMPSYGANYYNQSLPPQNHMFQEQYNDRVPYSGPNTEIPDGFDLIDDVSVQDFQAEPYSSGSWSDSYLM